MTLSAFQILLVIFFSSKILKLKIDDLEAEKSVLVKKCSLALNFSNAEFFFF